MIGLLVTIGMIGWFARTAKFKGENVFLWGFVGAVSYRITSIIGTRIFAIIINAIFNAENLFIPIFGAEIFGMIIGVSCCRVIYRSYLSMKTEIVQTDSVLRPLFPHLQKYGILVVLIIQFVIFSFQSPSFLTLENLTNIMMQISNVAIIAVGMTFVILTAGIDLSVGSIIALSGIVTTSILKFNLPSTMGMGFAIVGGLFAGMVCGVIAGFLITSFRVMPFMITLGLMAVWRGLALTWTQGAPILELPEMFTFLGNSRVVGVPFPTLLMLILYIVAWLILQRTKFGKNVFLIGENPEAARLDGIPIRKTLMVVYIISGTLAALSGILLASRLSMGQPSVGAGYELDVIAAVLLGGTSLFGGRGSIIGTFIGAVLIGVWKNGMYIMHIDALPQLMYLGSIILVAVLLDQLINGSVTNSSQIRGKEEIVHSN